MLIEPASPHISHLMFFHVLFWIILEYVNATTRCRWHLCEI